MAKGVDGGGRGLRGGEVLVGCVWGRLSAGGENWGEKGDRGRGEG